MSLTMAVCAQGNHVIDCIGTTLTHTDNMVRFEVAVTCSRQEAKFSTPFTVPGRNVEYSVPNGRVSDVSRT
jgi:hypothetical protein